MTSREGRLPLRELMAQSASKVGSLDTTRGVAVLLCSSARDTVEVVHREGLPMEIGRALSEEGGQDLLIWAQRTARPHLLRRNRLARRAPKLHGLLREEELKGMALLPLLGEGSVLGYLAVGLRWVPDESEEVYRHLRTDAWEQMARALQRLRIRVGTEVLRFLVARAEAGQGGGIEAFVVVDSEERVILSQGVSSFLPSWGRGEPTGESLRLLPGGSLLSSLRPSGTGGLSWHHRKQGGNGRDVEGPDLGVACVSPFTSWGIQNGWRVILIRGQGESGGGEGRADALLLELALRLTHSSERWKSLGGEEEAPLEEALLRDLENHSKKALTLAEEGSGRKAVDLSKLFRILLDRLEPEARDDRVRILPLLADDLPAIRGYGQALETSLWILLRRSWMSLLPQGGSITVRTWEEAGSVWCTISDDGPGIENETVEALLSLEPLLRDGDSEDLPDSDLALARKMVTTAGGSLHVESRPRLWTCYSVVFPAEASVEKGTSGVNLPPAVEVRRDEEGELGVLVVDDNDMVRTVLRKYLERRGVQVKEAVDGGVALNILREEDFDRVMVDVNMPGTTGLEFYRELDVVAPSMRDRTVFMTGGFQEEEMESQILETGRPHIKKPFDLEEISELLWPRTEP